MAEEKYLDETPFVFSRGMSNGEKQEMRDRNQQTIEADMVQREDRLSNPVYSKSKINVSDLLTGESKERWIKKGVKRRIKWK